MAADLWTLALGAQTLDPNELAEAVANQVRRGDLDFRTRLLIRDALRALEARWKGPRLRAWLASDKQVADQLEQIQREDLGDEGFPSLSHRMMEPTRSESIHQLLRELGLALTKPGSIVIGGSVALILTDHLSRMTEDIDVVDEVPLEIRSLGKELKSLSDRYAIRLTHFQSHYLPSGWHDRIHSIGTFGKLRVQLVDAYDVLLSKLFSGREKDRDDLRVAIPQLSKETLRLRMIETTKSFLKEERLRRHAADNWYILFGEELPDTKQ